MKTYRFIFSMVFLLGAVLRAELVGDLNHDGKLDIADYVRIQAMAINMLTPEAGADLDRDGHVTATDAEMLLGLIRGTYAMPQQIDHEITSVYNPVEHRNIMHYTGDGFEISRPNNTYSNQYTMALWTVDELPESPLTDAFDCGRSKTIGISNLTDISDFSVVLDVPKDVKGTPALLVGAQTHAKGSKETLWAYWILEVDGEELSYANHQLLWKPNRCVSSVTTPLTCSVTVLYPKAKNTRGAAVRGTSTSGDLDIDFTAIPSEYGPDHYLTTHFLIQAFGNFPVENIRNFARKLETAYGIIGDLGFKQDFPGGWGKRIRVNIRQAQRGDEPENSYCVEPGLLSGPLLEFYNGVLTSANMGSIAIHELMHYHHYNYAVNYKSLWLEEMCTAWSERLMSDDPENYRPAIFDDPRGVLDGLPMVSEKPSFFSDGATNKAASSHGYNLYPFAVWLTGKYPANTLWQKIFSSRGYQLDSALIALNQGLYSIDSQVDIGELYDEFVREYLSGESSIPYPSPSLTPLSCFNSADAARFAANGKKVLIKNAGDIYIKDNIEHTFQMSPLGTATWLFTFEQGANEFMKEHNEVLVRVNNTQYDLFVLRFENGKFSLTAPEDIVRDETKNISTIRVPLDNLGASGKRTAIGIVAVNQNYDEYDESRTNSVTLSMAFSGPFSVNYLAKTPYDVFINGVYRWMHDYTMVQTDLVVTPLAKTTFIDSSIFLSNIGYMGVEDIIPVAETHLGAAKWPDTLDFNITGTMTDIPVPKFLDLSVTYFFGGIANEQIWAECTGHYVVEVSKTVGKYSYSVPFEVNGAQGEYNAIYGGMTYTAEDFLPSGPNGLSRFNVSIKDVDPAATSYSIQIHTHYLTYLQLLESNQKINRGSWSNITFDFTILLK